MESAVSGSVAAIDSNFPPEHLHHLIRVLAGVFRPADTFVASAALVVAPQARPSRAKTSAVNKTHAYFHTIWNEDMHAVPRFLWNAKMRFGKTFTTYQLARKLGRS